MFRQLLSKRLQHGHGKLSILYIPATPMSGPAKYGQEGYTASFKSRAISREGFNREAVASQT